MSNKVYDVLKKIALVWLPALRNTIFCIGWNLGITLCGGNSWNNNSCRYFFGCNSWNIKC